MHTPVMQHSSTKAFSFLAEDVIRNGCSYATSNCNYNFHYIGFNSEFCSLLEAFHIFI